MTKPTIQVVEVGPRDGIQSLGIQTANYHLTTDLKRQWIEKLTQCGLTHVEVGAFVNPKKVPAMADTATLLTMLPTSVATYRVLVPNRMGLDMALAAGARHIAVFTAASDGFTQHNIGQTVQSSLDSFAQIVPAALDAGITVRGYVSTVVQCPYDGPVNEQAVAEVAQALLTMGCYEVSLGETLGVAYPADIERVIDACTQSGITVDKLAIHAHDTFGRGVVNTLAAVNRGIRTVDSSAGGIGGCPFAPGAKGNVATEAIVTALADQYDTGIDWQALNATTQWFETQTQGL